MKPRHFLFCGDVNGGGIALVLGHIGCEGALSSMVMDRRNEHWKEWVSTVRKRISSRLYYSVDTMSGWWLKGM